MYKIVTTFIVLIIFSFSAFAQTADWQQKVRYSIDVKLDVETNIMKGKEVITYWNNSPDELDKIFVHLYWNAFQPGSMMDEKSRNAGQIILGRNAKGDLVRDWDGRVTDRISKLKPEEYGYQKIEVVRVNGEVIVPQIHQTIMQIPLKKKILPGTVATIEIVFETQVPVQVRRAGRDNEEGVRYSMAQWYPRIAGYDHRGWHPYQYIGREFYGPFGDFNVNITIDKNYLVAGTGTLQNPNETGFGYGSVKGVPKTSRKETVWRFKANNVHDFVWAADPEYVLSKRKIDNGPLLYFVYKQKDEATKNNWGKMAENIEKSFPFITKTFGPYRYPSYAFIQAADGGMEYPMATLIKGPSLGTALHELGHNWYQGTIGTNEALFAWMDEGGATYFEERVSGYLNNDSMWYKSSYDSYYDLVNSRLEEPMSTHADHFSTNYAYSLAAYGKGMVFYAQLAYIIGNKNMDDFLIRYEDEWKYKHPEPFDMVKVAEDVSGLQLQWYKDYWMNTTKVIDYSIAEVIESGDSTSVELRNEGNLPMPVDVLITYTNNKKEMLSIPVDLMFGNKPAENSYYPWKFLPAWDWTNKSYIFKLPVKRNQIKSIEIDPSKRLADIKQSNNNWKK